MITNIDVADGLPGRRKVVQIERKDWGDVSFAWLEFPDLLKAAKQVRKSIAGHVVENSISKTTVPIWKYN